MRTNIQPCTEAGDDWLALRLALWPEGSAADHRREMEQLCAEPGRYGQFLARDSEGRGVGFAEASIRQDHVNGADASPVGFLEGIYVNPDARRRGVARALVDRVASWVRERGCAVLASDASLDNSASHAMHRALEFTETERVVYFRREI